MATSPINTLPCHANTSSLVVGNLEMAGLDALAGVAPDWVNISAPNGGLPYDPACPNFQGLPWNGGGVTVGIGQQHAQSNSLALLLIIVLLWALLL